MKSWVQPVIAGTSLVAIVPVLFTVYYEACDFMVLCNNGAIIQSRRHQCFVTRKSSVADACIWPDIYAAAKSTRLEIVRLVGHIGIPAELIVVVQGIINRGS